MIYKFDGNDYDEGRNQNVTNLVLGLVETSTNKRVVNTQITETCVKLSALRGFDEENKALDCT